MAMLEVGGGHGRQCGEQPTSVSALEEEAVAGM